MVVVDTGSFIKLLRGDRVQALEALMVAGLTLLSSTVYLELMQGVRRVEEKQLARFLESQGDVLPWPRPATCLRIIRLSRGSGIRVGLPDILILADAMDQRAKLMTLDRQVMALAKRVGIGLVEVE